MNRQHPYLQKINLLFTSINQVNPYYLVLLVLCGHFLAYIPNGVEECYFPLAKQFVNPDWMPNSFVFNEWSGTRILYQYITGFLLQFISFEQLALWGRLFIFMVSALPLTKLFKHFNFSNISILILLELFLVRQSWIGGSHIFGGIESKSFAYVFVLYSLVALFNEKYLKSILLAAAASYFHILVGGWYSIFALSYILIFKRSFVQAFKPGIIYGLLMAPFIYFLSSHIIGSGNIINEVNIDWVYTYYRNPHHCVPFSRPDWIKVVLPSLIQLVITSILIVVVMRKKESYKNTQLFWMTAIIHIMLWLAIIISIVNTSGSISKYYLYRINATGALIFYIYVFWWTIRFHPTIARKAGYILFFLFFVPSFIGRTTSNVKKNIKAYDTQYIELVDFVKNKTNANDVIIEYSDMPLSFMRMTERESFVIKKLVPGGGEKIYEWYVRMQLLEEFRDTPASLPTITKHYKINYLVSKSTLSIDRTELIFTNNKYYLYKLTD